MSKTVTISDLTLGQQTFARSTIVRFQAIGDYTHMFIDKEEKPRLITKSLGKVSHWLADEINFVRISRNNLVNRHYMQRVSTGTRPLLILSSGMPVQVPRERAAKIRAVIRQKNSF